MNGSLRKHATVENPTYLLSKYIHSHAMTAAPTRPDGLDVQAGGG